MILISVMWRESVDVSPADGCSPLPNKYQSANRDTNQTADPATEATEDQLEPASPAVPAATEKNKHYEDDD
jgi:hypothetical protein